MQRLGDGGPFGAKLGARGALDSGRPEGAVVTLAVDPQPPVPRPGEEVPEAGDPRAQALKGGEDTGGASPPSPLVGGGEHPGGLAVRPPQQREVVVWPPVLGELGGRVVAATSSPSTLLPAALAMGSSRSYVYSDLVGYQTSDIRLLWTIITKP